MSAMDPIIIADEEVVYSSTANATATNLAVYPPEYEGHFSRILIHREAILSRVASLAELIHRDYEGKRPVFLCVLKGATPVRVRLPRLCPYLVYSDMMSQKGWR